MKIILKRFKLEIFDPGVHTKAREFLWVKEYTLGLNIMTEKDVPTYDLDGNFVNEQSPFVIEILYEDASIIEIWENTTRLPENMKKQVYKEG